jgi:hypothetical protein
MNKEVRSHIDKSIDLIGIEATKRATIDMLNQSLKLKKDLETKNRPLLNVPSHIEMAYEILDYLDVKKSEKRDNIISSLFENRIMDFDSYTFKILLTSYLNRYNKLF